MRRLLSLATLALLALALAVLFAPFALAHHVSDGGVDEPWTNAMNQETYWESRFATAQQAVECTKFENHAGFIPESYEAAVIKDGNWVRVYASLAGATNALGALNPANGQHFGGQHSWVMKCDFYPVTTTTLETTTTTEATTTTVGETTTTQGETTTTAQETTTTEPETTTTVGETTTTIEGAAFSYSLNCQLQGGTIIEVHVTGLEPGDVISGGGQSFTVKTDRGNLSVLAPATFDVLVNGESIGTVSGDELDCEELPTTTDPDELPFTGVDSGLLVGLGASGLALGALTLYAARTRED